jgi:hypothetical protein
MSSSALTVVLRVETVVETSSSLLSWVSGAGAAMTEVMDKARAKRVVNFILLRCVFKEERRIDKCKQIEREKQKD